MWGGLWVLAGLAVARAAGEAEGPRLSLPRALLPLSQPAALALSVSGGRGCYSWSSSRDDVVSVVPIRTLSGCSTSANIITAPQLTHRQTAIIFAEDVDTKQVLRCDIMIDKITSLIVATTTRELFVEEAPVAFEVRAFNEQGNKFTTLDGVEFSWTVLSQANNDIIRIITFAESSYTALKAIQDLESRGLQGDTVLLEGISTGSSKVRVKLLHPDYSAVKSVEVVIRVIANLLVIPSDVYIQLDDSVHFKIIQVREGKFVEFKESPQYWLEIEDNSIAKFNKNTGIAIGKTIGNTRILLRDADEAADSETVTLPEANLYVVTPYALRLELYPIPISRPWSVQCGDDITIIVHILDKNGKRIYIGPETRVGLELTEELIDVEWKSVNGTVLYGNARQPGVVSIVASLLSVAGKPVKSKITTTGEIRIYNKIQVVPPHVILPWDSIYHTRSDFLLSAVGGDGSYVWHADGSMLVNTHGLITTNSLGNATVTASMASNPRIFGTASVQVVDPSNIEVVWYEEEGPVGSLLSIHVALFAEMPLNSGKYVPYNNCNPKLFKINTVEGIDFEIDQQSAYEEKTIGSACTILKVKCIEAGIGLIGIQSGLMQVGLSLSCYAPLERVYPPPNHSAVILTVGSSLNVIFKGGPVSRFDAELHSRREVNVENSDIAKVAFYPISIDNMFHVYTVTCLEVGETNANLKIKSNQDEDDSSARVSEALVDIHCSNPHSVKLSSKQNLGVSCPTMSSSQMLVNGGGPVEVEVIFFDNHGQKFHNASSLRVRWSGKPTAILPDVPLERMLTKISHIHGILIPDFHYQMLTIAPSDQLNKTNNVDINIETIGFRNAILRTAGVDHAPILKIHPHATLSLRLISQVQVPSPEILVYNHPGGAVQIPLVHGSGTFKVTTSHDDNARVILDPALGRNLKITPLIDGDVTVSISDLCVTFPPTTFHVRIVSIFSIVADIPELIEKGQVVQCAVKFYDNLGNVLPAQVNGAPSLTSRITEDRINLIPITSEDINNEAITYNVTGLEVGDARIEFTANTAKGFVHTHVFAPLQLIPRTSVILPGGSIKLGVIGGPPPPAMLRFQRASKLAIIVDVTNDGVVLGLGIGSAVVEACADGFRGAELACASANVNVISLEGITIHAPTSTLLTGNTMPLWAMGIPDSVGPIELGSLKPLLRFSWSLSGDGAGSITDVLSITGLEFGDTDRVSVRLTAIQSGSITVHLNVTATPISALSRVSGNVWQSKIEILAIDPLTVVKPSVSGSQLLVAPYSTVALETNYNPDKITYRLIEDDKYSEDDGPIAEISSDGKLTTFGRIGFGVVIISTIDSYKQNISITIEVSAPYYSMMELVNENSWNYLSGLGSLPAGLNLPLIFSKFDILGRRLAMSSQNVQFNTNRPDLLHASFNSSQIQEVYLAGSGRTVIKLWDIASEKQFSDYASLKIQESIYPKKILATVGDVWCMRSAVRGGSWIDSLSGVIWTSEDGMAQAQISRVAATSLLYQAPPGLPYTTQASIITRAADSIYFLNIDVVHVVTDEIPYTVDLVLANHEEQEKINNLLFDEKECLSDPEHLPFTCEFKHSENLSMSQLRIEPVFNKNTGTYGCQITWTSDSSTSISSNNSNGVIILARIGSAVTEPLFIRCIRAAIVQPDKVILSPPPASLSPVDITASPEVLKQITLETDGDVLSIQGPTHLSDTSARYIVRATTDGLNAQKGHILLISPLTHQRTEIPIVINNGNYGMGGYCNTGGGSSILAMLINYQSLYIGIIAVIVIMVITVYIYGHLMNHLKEQNDEINMNTTPINDISSNIRSLNYQSRSPLSLNSTGVLSSSPVNASLHQTSTGSVHDTSGSVIYGDPSYLAPFERRRTRRFL